MHSTELIMQVAQRPSGTSGPLPDAGLSAAMPPRCQRGLQRAGMFLQPWTSVNREGNSHLLLLHTSQALFLLGFWEDMGASN